MYKQLIQDMNEKITEIPKTLTINRKEIKIDAEIGKCFDLNMNEIYHYWASFDPRKGYLNFHIVPEKERDNVDKMNKIREKLKDEVKELNGEIIGRGFGQSLHAAQHKWIEIVIENDSFLLSFQTLSFDKEHNKDILNCYLDKIQFYKFPKAVNGPNYVDEKEGKLVILYPDSGTSEKKEGVNPSYPEYKIVVQNTKLNLKDSSEEKIVKEFIAFIEKNTNYNEVRKQYIKERNKERKKIIKYVFEDMGYKVKKSANAGHGSTKYTSGGQMKEFDLSYWMWVEGEKAGKTCSVYLQSFDRDPNGEQNYHVLLDRLSIQIGDGEIKRTEIDLPLDDEKICLLKDMINL